MRNTLFILAALVILISCEGTKYTKISESNFAGTWLLHSDNIFDSLEIELKEDPKKGFIGEVVRLNTNKYVQLFMESGDIFISNIERKSNFEFIFKIKKIAAPLFSSYGEKTTIEHTVTFEGEDKIMIGKNGEFGVLSRLE